MATYINTNQDTLHRRRHLRPDSRDHPDSTPRLDDDADERLFGGAKGTERVGNSQLVAGRELAGRGDGGGGRGDGGDDVGEASDDGLTETCALATTSEEGVLKVVQDGGKEGEKVSYRPWPGANKHKGRVKDAKLVGGGH